MNTTSGFTYEIEGNVDFFKELKQMGSTPYETVSLEVEDNTAKCLITDDKLRKDHVTLKCGHRFNYIPLFKEVLFQKCSLLPKNLSTKIITTYTKHANTHVSTSSSSSSATNTHTTLPTINHNPSPSNNVTSVLYNSSYNLETTKLHYNEMKCPYCRRITPYILPYYPYPDVCKVKYVNVPTNLSLPGVSGEYKKFVYGPNDELDDIFLDDKNSCRAVCMYNEKYDLMLCTKHLNKLEAGTVSRKPTTTTTTASKPIRKSKTKTKQTANIDDENVIISHHNPATAVCSFLLLSGPRKGCPCEKPMWVPKLDSLNTDAVSVHAAYCKAHYNKCVK
jgi:hypothetical protein